MRLLLLCLAALTFGAARAQQVYVYDDYKLTYVMDQSITEHEANRMVLPGLRMPGTGTPTRGNGVGRTGPDGGYETIRQHAYAILQGRRHVQNFNGRLVLALGKGGKLEGLEASVRQRDSADAGAAGKVGDLTDSTAPDGSEYKIAVLAPSPDLFYSYRIRYRHMEDGQLLLQDGAPRKEVTFILRYSTWMLVNVAGYNGITFEPDSTDSTGTISVGHGRDLSPLGDTPVYKAAAIRWKAHYDHNPDDARPYGWDAFAVKISKEVASKSGKAPGGAPETDDPAVLESWLKEHPVAGKDPLYVYAAAFKKNNIDYRIAYPGSHARHWYPEAGFDYPDSLGSPVFYFPSTHTFLDPYNATVRAPHVDPDKSGQPALLIDLAMDEEPERAMAAFIDIP